MNFLISKGNKNPDDAEEKMEHGNDADRDNEDDEKESSIRLPLKEGRVTGLPKDIATAPTKLRLSRKLQEQGYKAIESTRTSGNECGFFIHFTEGGEMLPREVTEGV